MMRTRFDAIQCHCAMQQSRRDAAIHDNRSLYRNSGWLYVGGLNRDKTILNTNHKGEHICRIIVLSLI